MTYIYKAPTLTVDAVIFQLIEDQLSLLLIKRARKPFAGKWALPGGYVPEGETTRQALSRNLFKKTGIDVDNLGYLEQFYAFDTVARDPRGHAVSVSYLGLSQHIQLNSDVNVHESSELENPTFFSVNKLPKLAFDHELIIKSVLNYLISKIDEPEILKCLMPESFTFTELQLLYEAILCRRLDKRNFRKRITSLDLLEPINDRLQVGAHRPARVYRINRKMR
jgi:8-oxo-dGTP diphosphatase